MGNRVRSRERGRRAHVPNQEKAGIPNVAVAAEVRVQVLTDKVNNTVGIAVTGGADTAHRQLTLFRGLEQEMRGTMVFYQQVHRLMEIDPEVKTAIEDFIRDGGKPRIVGANGQAVAQVEATKVGG